MFLKISQNSQENTFPIFIRYFLEYSTVIKQEALAQVFSCEFCKIFKNIFFTEQIRVTAYGISYERVLKNWQIITNQVNMEYQN